MALSSLANGSASLQLKTTVQTLQPMEMLQPIQTLYFERQHGANTSQTSYHEPANGKTNYPTLR